MKYKNTKTGFVFDSPCDLKGEDWVKLNPSPVKDDKDKKPVKDKRIRKDD